MVVLLWPASTSLLGSRGPDTVEKTTEKIKQKSISTLSTTPYPITKAYCAQFVSVIPLLV